MQVRHWSLPLISTVLNNSLDSREMNVQFLHCFYGVERCSSVLIWRMFEWIEALSLSDAHFVFLNKLQNNCNIITLTLFIFVVNMVNSFSICDITIYMISHDLISKRLIFFSDAIISMTWFSTIWYSILNLIWFIF